MFMFVRSAGLFAVLLLVSASASAATPKEIDNAIKKGAEWIKARYRNAGGAAGANYGIGPACLSGLALLEAGVPGTDPAVKNITAAVRNAAYTETKTYQTALCLMYLDRYGEPSDVPLIQALAVRLLAGQQANGGWGYDTVGQVSQADEQGLRGLKADQGAGKLHPDIQRYGQALFAARGNAQAGVGDDNSNTQFAVIAVWLSRKHGVPVEGALDLVERRYLVSQNPRTGGWGYNGPSPNGGGSESNGSPAMHCAGLIGLATGIARRDEARAKAEPKKEPPKEDPAAKPKLPDDPFFNPPPKLTPAEPKKNPANRPLDARDKAAQLALAGLGVHLRESAQAGRGALVIKGEGAHGHHDLYFLWSVERVGVIFGVEKIGGVDWYAAGTHSLVHTQSPDGSWGGGHGYGDEVNTAFAMLVLCKADLARDLSGKVQKETETTMRAGIPSALDPKGTLPNTGGTGGNPLTPAPILPGAAANESATLAAQLILASGKEWDTVLTKLRDSKGIVHTQALVTAVNRLDGDKRKVVREVLAERLTRMTPKTLREMAKVEDPEWRRAAVLAMAMKDDNAHVPDLIAAIADDEDLVVRAARAGLKSLTGEDFGPAATSTAGEKALSASRWRDWLAKQKK